MYKKIVTPIVIGIIVTLALIWTRHWTILALAATVAILYCIPKTSSLLRSIQEKMPANLSKIIYWIKIVAVSVLLVFFVKTYLFDILRLPSKSMEPNFKTGQIIVVNKLLAGPRLNYNDIDNYSRASHYSSIQRNDIVVFNLPKADTTGSKASTETGSAKPFTILGFLSQKDISLNPRYIKRIIGLPGDTVEITSGITYINKQSIKGQFNQLAKYKAKTTNIDSLLAATTIKPANHFQYKNLTIFEIATKEIIPSPTQIFEPFHLEKNLPDPNIFPHVYFWNADNMGPIVVPGKGTTIQLNIKNLSLYRSIIEQHEGNTLEVKKTNIFINGSKTDQYTFKTNYYWAMGDNHPRSFDSRYWGFLPENFIIGVSRTHFNLGF